MEGHGGMDLARMASCAFPYTTGLRMGDPFLGREMYPRFLEDEVTKSAEL